MEPTLRVHVDAHVLPGPIRLKVTGDLTADTCQSLFDILDSALTLHGCPSVTIDLLTVTSFDPDGIQRLEDHVSLCRATAGAPLINIEGLPKTLESPDVLDQAGFFVENFEPAQRTAVQALMSPIGPTVFHSQLLKDIAGDIAELAEPVIVTDDAGQPLSIITEADIDWITDDDPEGWHRVPCGQLAETSQHSLRVEDPLAEVLSEYQRGRIRPLLVFDGPEVVGVLHPTSLFQWCAEHHPMLLSTLSVQALQNVSEAAEPAESSVLEEPLDRTAI